MSGPSNRRNQPERPKFLTRPRLVIAVGLLVIVLAAGLYLSGVLKTQPQEATDPFAVTPLPTSPYLNTGPDARYVGSEVCRACHEERHASFRTSGMGRSMADVDLTREPPDASYDHVPSGRRYQVRRQGNQLWHRELLLGAGSQEIVLSEYPVRYVVGSGRHSRTYLVEAEGFLVESPVTWYTSRQAWGMSPGYDAPDQVGFERATGEGCLDCHAGRAEAVGKSLHRMRVMESAIGCERCHGPGSIHIDYRREQRAADKPQIGDDRTIVNPAKLPRELAEAVCQQCHLRSDANIPLRGRKPQDFRPGLPLQAIRADYFLKSGSGSMTVVGHVEQLHQSRCYQRSDSLSCLTCHSPHSEPRPEDRVAHYQAICLNCHAMEQCKVDPGRLKVESPSNDCVRCHMPTSPTEIPHLAFTHHRIGKHVPQDKVITTRSEFVPSELRAFLDLTHMSELDRNRSLGLGYLEAANRSKVGARSGQFREEALKLLSGVLKTGIHDPATEVAMGRLRFEMRLPDVGRHAIAALANPNLVGQDRCTALFLLADENAASNRHREAIELLHELTQLRRHPSDWLLLADCEGALGNQTAKEEALTTAVRINPRLWKVHQYLADQYRQRGDRERANWHHQRAAH